MATLSQYAVTLLDLTKRLDPQGKIDKIAEMLVQKNEILQDIPWVECNNGMGHLTTVRTGLPTPTWKLLNAGVQPTKSRTAQITESCGILESWSEIAEDLVNLSADKAAFLLSESKPHIEGLGQEVASTLFGGSAAAPEEFIGLNARFNSKSAENGRNIVDAGGTQSDNSSVWFISWGEDSVHGIYPKGSQAGLKVNPLGVETVEVTAGVEGTRMRAYRTQFQWMCGLALRDWRYAVRIANIDISNLVAKSSAADLFDQMIAAYHKIESRQGCRIYMNRTVQHMLDIQTRDDVSAGKGFTYENVDGVVKTSFRGIPVRTVDALPENEARVT